MKIRDEDGNVVRVEDGEGNKLTDIEELRQKIVEANGNPQILECLNQIVNYIENEW